MQGPVSGPEPSKGDNAAATAGAPQVRGCAACMRATTGCAWSAVACIPGAALAVGSCGVVYARGCGEQTA
jgi:hypothetical protein